MKNLFTLTKKLFIILSLLFATSLYAEDLETPPREAVDSPKVEEKTHKVSGINNIEVQGNKRMTKDAILSYAKINKNFSPSQKAEVIKRLYALGLFEQISIEQKGNTLFLIVKENPIISAIEFKGNSKLSGKAMLKELSIQKGEVLSRNDLQEDLNKIRAMYAHSGKYVVEINPIIKPIDETRVKLIFEIKEGPKSYIKKIYFSGNNNYTDKELASIIASKEYIFFRILNDSTLYSQAKLQQDKALLTEFYNSVGFVDFQVISVTPELSPTKEYYNITFSIDEGRAYKVGEVIYQNKFTFDDKQIKKIISLVRKGETYSLSKLQALSLKINRMLAGLGYPYLVLNITPKKDMKAQIIDLNFNVDYGSQTYVNKINIQNNIKTSDYVIRREILLAEGDYFNNSFYKESIRRLSSLDYFDLPIEEEVTRTPGSEDVDINIKVKEKSTAHVKLQGNYSTLHGLGLSLGFSESNLFGQGYILDSDITWREKDTSFNFGLTDPYFMGYNFALGAEIFRNVGRDLGDMGQGLNDPSSATKDIDKEAVDRSFKKHSYGFRIMGTYSLADNITHNMNYKLAYHKSNFSTFLSDDLQKNLDSLSSDKKELLFENKDKILSSVTNNFTFDFTDNSNITKNGYLFQVSQEFAGLGGSVKYLKHIVSAKYFKSIMNNDVTLKLSAQGGNIRGLGGQTVSLNDRFSIGGSIVRGFSLEGIGPRLIRERDGKDNSITKTSCLNGLNYYGGSMELIFPVGLPKELNVKGAIFTDFGNSFGVDYGSKDIPRKKESVWESKKMRASIGFSIIWQNRVAPIRIDWSIPVSREKFDERQAFNLGMAGEL